MLQFTPQHRLLLATQPIDFRRGIDGLAACCRQVLEQDPFTGTFFIFTNKRKTAVKILVYDGQGFWLCLKRFSKGRLAWWPDKQASLYPFTAQQLTLLLYQAHPLQAKLPADFRPVSPDSSTAKSPRGSRAPPGDAAAGPLNRPPD